MRNVMVVLALCMVSGAAGCRGQVQYVHWGEVCTLRVQRSFDDVSVGAVEEGQVSACMEAAPESTVYVYGRDPVCPHGWLWFSARYSAESLQAKIEKDLAARTLPCLNPG